MIVKEKKYELYPCPFCGSSDIDIWESYGLMIFRIHCIGCGCYTASNENKLSCVDSWNKRYFPEGCTPADARHLREGNFDIATEIQELQALVLTAWETIEEAGYQDHNEELKEKVEGLQGSL